MNYAMVKRLILKDCYLQRWPILLSILGGAASLAVVVGGGKAGFILGTILLVTALITIGATLTLNMTVMERREQTLAFLMSLPISYREYTAAKLLGVLLMFSIPWSLLMAASLAALVLGPGMPDGLVPYVSIMGTEILVSTCLIAAVGLITESQGWTITALMVGNLALNGIGYLVAHLGGIARFMFGPAVRWTTASFGILAIEFGAIVLILGGTLLLQSRKKDFL
jgi:ABC-type transport system involved in multi-copper enzyme maturation permease subunit